MASGTGSPMHRTMSLDYGVVLEGEEGDPGEKRRLPRDDFFVQRGTTYHPSLEEPQHNEPCEAAVGPFGR
ncbi:uncharacterized protein Z518_10987 [Rhinocladiella mackenziei CBS 650.93]|uniref:Uncharacterized protein n=1 Tax=Rhinocladiella mackenziei CBS 650.93 TaxID=1442369 RepID=A0A0D2ITM1_9EURO|nr:uncharacterized protein Z518_10987 [Rhinocladiella mackenziei CBS 650.93]KIX00060.1 hypothetical protein Z518_10987 [Rhinocladiella mackenziei CBS 650.93]